MTKRDNTVLNLSVAINSAYVARVGPVCQHTREINLYLSHYGIWALLVSTWERNRNGKRSASGHQTQDLMCHVHESANTRDNAAC